ncbi:hypothetical protein A5844_000022 [Enterococcus sp. 10A9_DIV0425]|uniref:N-acetyltransferase domain-containing protein n=1 Tax=Candidatus Enterococcus wittei TaxID=1987383 RepID=A0A2C9XPN6_9ENTE|nr:GNAT family N-acetyltransferase [Enterococcus sp. 10A9_DIV0425]OTP11808.1 hypothetical protein A5844_000022 [Enterococcus sp. 10A9_DIV0425]THE09634.1 GNAT family N-acetyltransferase [Enterococcus hirae]
MLIREMKRKDNQQVKQIIQSSLKSVGLAIEGTAYFDPQLNDLFDFYQKLPHGKYWVVEIDQKVVGGIGIAPFDEKAKICELQKLYLKPEVQGLGIANLLMNTALYFASEYYDQCYLETRKELAAACKLYEKFGFQSLSTPLEGSEHSAMDIWYIKKL